jgi:DNA-binding XRE family transcriptional regulator
LEDEVRRRQGLLTPAEIKAVRERTGLSQEAIAHWLGVGEKTYTRWETGKSVQNKANDSLIRLLNLKAERLLQVEVERRPNRTHEIADYVAHLQDIKGENDLAMAAHGARLPRSTAGALRRRLQELLKD